MRRTIVMLVALTALLAGAVTANAAKPGPGPIATPAAACEALVSYGFGGFASFGDCMSQFNGLMQAYTSEGDSGEIINLDQRCTELESAPGEEAVTYPFFFVEFPGFPFVEFTGVNHHQCMVTLFAYHFVFESLFGP